MQVSYTNTGEYFTHARHTYISLLAFFIQYRMVLRWAVFYTYIRWRNRKQRKKEEQLSIVTKKEKNTHEMGQEWNGKL